MNDGGLIELRALLAEKFPAAHHAAPGAGPGGEAARFVETGIGVLDAVGVARGTLVELVGREAGGLAIDQVLACGRRDGWFTALVDGSDTFDPQSAGAAACRRLLWVRCRAASEAVRAADFLLRDGNLPLVLVDLQMNPARELGRIPGSSWFRLRSLAEATSAVLVALTERAFISAAHLRLDLEAPAGLEVVDRSRDELAAAVTGRVARRRSALAGDALVRAG